MEAQSIPRHPILLPESLSTVEASVLCLLEAPAACEEVQVHGGFPSCCWEPLSTVEASVLCLLETPAALKWKAPLLAQQAWLLVLLRPV